MSRLFRLTDEAWRRIAPHRLHGQPGKPRIDDGQAISGIPPVLKVGCRWRDAPSAWRIDPDGGVRRR